MQWAGRLFEERYTWVRITVLTLSGVGYLVLAPDGDANWRALDLTLAITAIVYGFVGVWSSLAVVLGLSVMASLELFTDVANWTVPEVAFTWALVELSMRAPQRQRLIGLGAALLGMGLHDAPSSFQEPLLQLFRFSVQIGVPFLLGAYFRAQQQLAHRITEHARQEIQAVRAEERTSIAREIHDLVAHHVASIVLRVGVARNVLPLNDPRVEQVLDDVHATGTSALADLRKLVAVLRDPAHAQQTPFVDPEGLEVALTAAIERSRQIGLTVTADVDPQVKTLDARTALAVLRIVQEGLANVAKHAGLGARAHLDIGLSGDRLTLALRDFGGMPSTSTTQGGHGLVGLRERITVLGGTLTVMAEDPGWSLTATMPLTDREAAQS